jgi:putative transposase
MPKRKPVLAPNLLVHITARSVHRTEFPISSEKAWKIFEDYLYLLHHGFGIRILQFVLMPNHFHLCLRPTEANLPDAMNYFMRETSKAIGSSAKRINQVYGSPYHPTAILNNHHYLNTYKYVYRNPVKAGLCANVEDYSYSTLHGKLGKSRLIIPTEDDSILFNPEIDWTELDWLNTPPSEDDDESIGLALKKSVFKLPSRPGSYPNRLENVRL